ncbi:hypothetical protein [Haladaptatus sp. DJG-WS-42]|uniref:DUF7471 family protein n=1 Tax=Haladaptatus sp. DJG-WS-42 TaxID=3120516 RepID=UPI0030D51FC1
MEWFDTPLHAASPAVDFPLVVLVGLASVGAAILLGLALAAFLRRQSRPYLFIALALCAVFAQSIVAALSVTGMLETNLHHLLEHSLDVLLVALVIGAVYYARTISQETDTGQ